MSWAHYCDRCGAELWRASSSRVQRFAQVTDEAGASIAELCEACTVELGHWLDEKAAERAEAAR